MTKYHDFKISLFDILKSAENSIKFSEGMNYEEFEEDLKTSSAVLHQIMLMGEAVKRLPREFKEKYPILPWKEMAGTRDILIHNYEEADLMVVWGIISKDLPVVVIEIKKLLDSIEKEI